MGGGSVLYRVALFALLSSCASRPADEAGSPASGPSHAPEGPAAPVATSTPSSDSPHDDCRIAGESYCSGSFRVTSCTKTAAGTRLVEITCASGEGCLKGKCTAGACSDECTVGDVAGGRTCTLQRVGGGATSLASGTSTHDRARDYARWMRRDAMPFGGVASPNYHDPGTFADLAWENGVGDSSMVTGNYLASEAWRYRATGAPVARANALATLATLDLWLSVTGEPGNLARFVRPTGAVFLSALGKPVALPDLSCDASQYEQHCNVAFGGKSYDYIGHVSRDEYTGVVMGLTAAYDALEDRDEAQREIIRKHLVVLATELAKKRQVAALVTFDWPSLGITPPLGLDLTIEKALDVENVVLIPREMAGGKVYVRIAGGGGGEDTYFRGMQEWIPDPGSLLSQLSLPPWATGIVSKLAPRSSSAIMLASVFRAALHVTEKSAAHAADHAALESYYKSHIASWLGTAATWSYESTCGLRYYGVNITMQSMFDLARLETDPTLNHTIQTALLDGSMWTTLRPHKNAWFDLIIAGASASPPAGAATEAAAQLAKYRPPPAALLPIDLTSSVAYAKDPKCPGNASSALDLDVRPQADLMWQRHPWMLVTEGRPAELDPGIAYLEAYWLARSIGAMNDDAVGRCASYR